MNYVGKSLRRYVGRYDDYRVGSWTFGEYGQCCAGGVNCCSASSNAEGRAADED